MTNTVALQADTFGKTFNRTLKLALLGTLAVLSTTQASFAYDAPDRPSEFTNDAGGKFLLVDFYSPYCGTCKMMAPHVQELEGKTNGKVNFKHVDVSQGPNNQYVKQFHITGTPTYVLFNPDGKAVYKMENRISPVTLEKQVMRQL